MKILGPALKKVAEQARKRAEEWGRMFPGTKERCARHAAGVFTEEEIAEARKRIARDDYPPTPFGEYLRDFDQRAVAAQANP